MPVFPVFSTSFLESCMLSGAFIRNDNFLCLDGLTLGIYEVM